MNNDNTTPQRKLDPYTVIVYGFPSDKPIFWGPKQHNTGGIYGEPVGWRYNESLSVPFVVRLIHDDTSVDSDTADNTDGNPDPGDPGPNPWFLYDYACYVETSLCDISGPTGDHCKYQTSCTGIKDYLNQWCKGTCGSPYDDAYGICSKLFGYITPPSTGGTPLFDPSAPLILALNRGCDGGGEDEIWQCVRMLNSDFLYNGSIAGACGAGYLYHMYSQTTWFWRRPLLSGPDPYEYTYTIWVNKRWLDEAQTILDPDFVNMEWCHPGEPLYPGIP